MATPDYDASLTSTEANRRELGERIREAMRQKRWRQTDLVTASGLDKAAVSRIVTGRRVPGPDALAAISRALDCTEDDLLPGITALRAGRDPTRPLTYFRAISTRSGRVLVEMRREVDARTALEVQRLVEEGAGK